VRPLFVLLVTTLSIAAVAASGCGRAEAFESFTLEEHDKIIAEAPGCYASCTAFGSRRTCTIKEMDCRAVCQTLPECKVDMKPIRVCAVVRARP
jgi:hypothetical protein